MSVTVIDLAYIRQVVVAAAAAMLADAAGSSYSSATICFVNGFPQHGQARP
jgi:hypothetical protein